MESKSLRCAAYALPLLLGVFLLTSCCPPYCPCEPGDPRCGVPTPKAMPAAAYTPEAIPSQMLEGIKAGAFSAVSEQSERVMSRGTDAPYFAQAALYHGVANARQNQDLRSALSDLNLAEARRASLSVEEQLLLFRTQMVVLARLGDAKGAEAAMNEAIKLAPPDQQGVIRQELDDASRR